MEIDRWTYPTGDWFGPLGISLLQAALSAAGSMTVGLLMVMGALTIRRSSWQKAVEFWLLVPNLMPSLFLILAILNIARLQFGLAAVVFAHILLNSGLVALAILRLLNLQLSGSVDLAVIEGASRGMIWRDVILPSIRREILFLFLFVFSVCLTSFAIPLVLGGPRVTGMETLIYQTLRINGDWSLALFYTMLQSALLFLFAIAIPKPSVALSFTTSPWPELGVSWLLPLALLPTGLLMSGWVIGVGHAVVNFAPESIDWNNLLRSPLALSRLDWASALRSSSYVYGPVLFGHIERYRYFSWILDAILHHYRVCTLAAADGG